MSRDATNVRPAGRKFKLSHYLEAETATCGAAQRQGWQRIKRWQRTECGRTKCEKDTWILAEQRVEVGRDDQVALDGAELVQLLLRVVDRVDVLADGRGLRRGHVEALVADHEHRLARLMDAQLRPQVDRQARKNG